MEENERVTKEKKENNTQHSEIDTESETHTDRSLSGDSRNIDKSWGTWQ